MITEGRSLQEKNIFLKTKYCIIGSGAGGAVAAERLSRDGNDVILIEEGGNYTPASFISETEAIAMAHLYRDAVMQTNEDKSITLLQGSAIGGSTFINHALCFRMPEIIFNDWTSSGAISDFTAGDLNRHYTEIESFLEPKTTPEMYMNSATKLFHKTFRENKISTVLTKRNTEGCVGCGMCLRSCPIGAKNGADKVIIPKALDNGAKVFSDFKAVKINFKGEKATSVEGTILSDSKQAKGNFKIEAEYIIVSAGAFHTPWLLKRSGLKNNNIGKHLKIHPLVLMQALYKNNMDSFNGVPEAVCSFEYTDYTNKESKGFILYCDFNGYMSSFHLPGLGNELSKRIGNFRKIGQTQILIVENSVGEINCKKEKPVISYKLNEIDKKEFVRATKTMGNLYFKSGALSVFLGNNEYTSPDQLEKISEKNFEPFSAHMVGGHFQSTCRMGTSSKDSVTDNSGKVFGTENLYVADASVLPGSVGINPMMSIMAFSSLIADRLAKKK